MKRKILLYSFLLIGLMCLFGLTSHAGRTIDKIKFPPLNEFTMPEVEKIHLDNGIVLYLLEDHELPIVRARIRLAGGGYLEPADKIGLAGITGNVMRTGGTARMTGDEIDEALESIGASVEVNIGNTGGSARMNILSEYMNTGLEILADILRTPQFNEDKIDLAKTGQRTAISSRNDEPIQVAVREFRKVIYGPESPYARHTEYTTIASITRNDLVNFHKMTITPENVMIAIWGDFDKNTMVKKIKKYFGDWAQGSGKVPKLPEVQYEFKSSVNHIEKESITQSTVLIGHIGGLTGDPDYFALTVANNVLGGGLGGRIFNEVRSRQGLAYATGSNFTTNIAFPGIYFNYVITKLETTAKASRALMAEIKRMQTDPPTPEELNKAKSSYLNSFVFNFDSKGEIINRMMNYDYYDFPQDFLFTVKENIENITAEDVLDVAQRRFHPDEMHMVVVGIADQFDEPLSVFGNVNSVDITIPSGEVEEEIAITPETLAKGKELLEKAIKASGGKKNIAKIKSTFAKMDVTIIMPQGELPLQAKSTFLLPDKMRDDFTTPMGEITNVSNGTNSWAKQGPQIIPATSEQIDDAKKELFRNTILLFQQADNPDYKVIYAGQDELAGKPVELIKIISTSGKMSFKMALDAKTFLPAGKYYFGKTMMGPGNLTEIYTDYKDISGVMIPYAIEVKSDGNKVMGTTIKEYKINQKIDESIFAKPE